MSCVVGQHRNFVGPDGEVYTEIWVEGRYSRIQAHLTVEQALAAVLNSRRQYTFK